MSFLELIDLTGYEILIALVGANLLAQIIKTVTYAIQQRRFSVAMLVSTGGMPSSHTSTVMAMTTSTGLIEGFDSPLFAICFCISAVVMYDAAGVRRSAGKQAKVLNQIIEELLSEEHTLNSERLKEFLGHTPKQVIAGAILGIAVSYGLRFLIESSLVM